MLQHLTSIRGRLVLWYLGVLAVLLLGLGIFQSLVLSSYLHSNIADTMRDTTRTQLAVLGPCYIRSSGDLRAHAQRLAQLLGSREIGVKIVTPSGATLADHGIGEVGARQSMRLSADTIRALIRSAQAQQMSQAVFVRPTECLTPPIEGVPYRRPHHQYLPIQRPSTQEGNLLLMAAPLGPSSHAVGYAILGRSTADIDSTVQRSRVVFGLGALLALLLAMLAALPIINRALRPLYRVARTAEAIAGGDLEKRANLTRSADEVGRLGIAFDRMVDRLQAALSAATESEERMRRFLADASHELRTPLTALRGTAEVLLRQGPSGRPEIDRALRAVHDETVRLSRLVDDLLTLSRLDAGQKLDPQPVVLRPFLARFVERYGQVWADRSIRVDSDSMDGASAFVDPDALTRVLTNLVDNAARYSAPGRPITLAGEATGKSVTIRVEDEGPGLDPEEAERIFQRFYRGARSRFRRGGGTGLGLAIVDALVRQSGGQIHMQTGPDRGTTVTMTFPRQS